MLVTTTNDLVGHKVVENLGLVRGADGALYLAEDPSRQVAPDALGRQFRALLGGFSGLFRWLRGLPLKNPVWHPHFFLRE